MSTYKIKNKTIVDPSMMNNFLNGRGVDFCLLAVGLNAKNHLLPLRMILLDGCREGF